MPQLLLTLGALTAIAAAARPYKGLVHDARLYFVQVLSRLHPDMFAGDLFLAFGSQDAFSIFSDLYAPLVSALGAVNAAMLYVAVFSVLWVVVVAAFVEQVAPVRQTARIATVAVLSVASHYGAYQVFAFAEPFATPRLMAEVLGLAAVVLLERRRVVVGVSLLILALATHPLMTVPVLSWMCVRHLPMKWLAGAVIAGVVLTAGLVQMDVDPFVRLVRHFDAEWFAVIQQRLEFAIPDAWNPVSWLSSALPIAGLSYAAVACADMRRPLARSLLLVTVVLLGASVFGSLSRNVLIVNLQLWRVLWVVGVVGAALYATICVDLWSRSALRYAIVLALVLAFVERVTQSPPIASGAVAAIALTAAWIERRDGALPRTFDLAVAALACLGLCVTLALAWAVGSRSGGLTWFLVAAADAALVGVAALFFLRDQSQVGKTAPIALVSALALVSVLRWDRRNDLHRYIEGGAAPNAVLQSLIAGKRVYWEDNVELLWLQYRSPSYYSCLQGAGLMFYDGTAREYDRRGRALARLNGGGFEKALGASCAPVAMPPNTSEHTFDSVTGACEALRDLDLLILPRRYPGMPPIDSVDVAMMRHRIDGRVRYAPGHVYVYDCSMSRS